MTEERRQRILQIAEELESQGLVATNSSFYARVLGHRGPCRKGDEGFWGTTEQETGVSAACWVANVLLSARDRRIWRNGHVLVRKSPLQKPRLVRQLLQSQIANLLCCMHLYLNRVFCSVAP